MNLLHKQQNYIGFESFRKFIEQNIEELAQPVEAQISPATKASPPPSRMARKQGTAASQAKRKSDEGSGARS
jgi:hypothetical protein